MTREHAHDFFVGDGSTEETYREPEPAILPLGTVFIEDGQRKVVGDLNSEGHAIAYTLAETRRGKLVVNPRSGGTPDVHDVVSVKKRTMKRKRFLAAFERGNRMNIILGNYDESMGRTLTEHIQEQWKPETRRGNRKK